MYLYSGGRRIKARYMLYIDENKRKSLKLYDIQIRSDKTGRLSQLGPVKTGNFEQARNGEGRVEPYFSIEFFFKKIVYFFLWEKTYIFVMRKKLIDFFDMFL